MIETGVMYPCVCFFFFSFHLFAHGCWLSKIILFPFFVLNFCWLHIPAYQLFLSNESLLGHPHVHSVVSNSYPDPLQPLLQPFSMFVGPLALPNKRSVFVFAIYQNSDL